MRLLIVSCVYPPEIVVSSRSSAEIASGLAERGHEVVVIAPRPSRAGSTDHQDRRPSRPKEAGALRVKHCSTLPSLRSTMSRRFLEYVSFGLTSAFALLREAGGARVVYANTWPIFGSGPVALAAKLRGVPLVLSVQDVYPESLVAQSRVAPGSLTFRFLEWIDGAVARSAAAVIVIADSFRGSYIAGRRVPSSRVHLIPNWGDESPRESGRTVDGAAVRVKLGVPESAFVFAYGGNVGVASGIENVVEAFAGLSDDPSAFLVVAGEGSALETCRARASALGLAGVRFLSPWRPDETGSLFAAADALVLPTRAHQAMASMPSKLIDYMLAARPILAVATDQSDLARTIREAACGWVLSPDALDGLPAELRRIRSFQHADLAPLAGGGRAYDRARYWTEAGHPPVRELIGSAIDVD